MIRSDATTAAQVYTEPGSKFVPLDRETRPALDTETAAYHLLLKPQTLRVWACYGNGPIHPLRVGRRLLWPTADIRKLLGIEA